MEERDTTNLESCRDLGAWIGGGPARPGCSRVTWAWSKGGAPGSKPISLQACPTMETCQQGSGPTHRCETITSQAMSCWCGVCIEGQDWAGALGLRDGSRRQRQQLLGSCPPRAGLLPGCREAAGQGGRHRGGNGGLSWRPCSPAPASHQGPQRLPSSQACYQSV